MSRCHAGDAGDAGDAAQGPVKMTKISKNAHPEFQLSQEDWPAIERCMRSEEARILQSAHFQSSPTLTRLLQWLVNETLSGRGNRIKSYTIAVEGLGKPEQFDSQLDSYPRVQVARLRKALQIYYSQQESVFDKCLHLQNGSYRIRLEPRESAYPLSRGSLPRETQSVLNLEIPKFYFLPKLLSDRPFFNIFSKWHGVLWAIAILGSLLWVTISFGNFARLSDAGLAVTSGSYSPVVRVVTVLNKKKSKHEEIANSAFAVMADGLSKSWVAQVQLASGNDNFSPVLSNAKYQLEIQVDGGSAKSTVLFVRLIEIRSSNIIWSGAQPIDATKSMAKNVGPLIAQLAGPYGAIVRHEATSNTSRYEQGYPCLLRYISSLQSTNLIQGPRVSRCLQEPLAEHRLEPVRLALSTISPTVSTLSISKQTVAGQHALVHARAAVHLNPSEAFARFALSRAYFLRDDCNSGLHHAKLAIEANPYDPMVSAILGQFSLMCGYEEGLEMLNQAYQFRTGSEEYASDSLVFGATSNTDIGSHTPAKVGTAERRRAELAKYNLGRILITASLGDTASAQRDWKKFAAAFSDAETSPDQKLRRVILADVVRAKVLSFLNAKNVITE